MAKKKTPDNQENSNKSKKSSKSVGSTIYKNVLNNLSIVFLDTNTVELLKTNNMFVKIVNELANICYSLEVKEKISDQQIDEIATAYQAITNQKLQYKKVPVNDEADILDKLNYLRVFIKNTLNIEWNDIINKLSKQKSASLVAAIPVLEAEKIENVKAETVNEAPNNNTYSNNQYSSNYNAEDFLRNNNMSVEQIADNLMKQQANVLVRKDVMNNKFYQFDSKPKVFLWLKSGVFLIWILFFVVMLLLSIFQLVLGDKPFFVGSDFSQFTSGVTGGNSTQFDNEVIYHGTGDWFPLAMFAIAFLMMLYYVYGQIKNFKNDNTKYSFKSSPAWIIIFLTIFTILSPLMFGGIHILSTFPNRIESNNAVALGSVHIDAGVHLKGLRILFSSDTTWYFDNAANFPLYQTFFIINILTIVFSGLSIILSVAVSTIKPKLDHNRINDLIAKYYNDIKSGKIKVDNDMGNNGFGGVGGIFGGRNPFSPY